MNSGASRAPSRAEATRGRGIDRSTHTLLATHLVPYPPDSGGKVVTWQTLACLSRMGPVDVCAFAAPWERAEAAVEFERMCGTVVTLPLVRRSPAVWFPVYALRRLPYYIMRDYSRAMRNRIRALAAQGCDLVVADSLYMAPHVADLRIPKVLQQHNVESYLVREFFKRRRQPIVRWAGRYEVRHLAAFERDQCNAFDAIVTLSDADRMRLLHLGVRAPIMVIPPAVDPAEPVPEGPARRHVVHLGTHHWPPTIDGLRWYLRDVHPLVRTEMPDVEVILAGSRPPRDLRASDGKDGIRVLGRVEEPDRVYRSTAVFIVPLRIGGGVRLKILHALARGLAVVSTTAGCEGLDLERGQHLLVADDPQAFASAILALLRDPVLRAQLGAQGRSHVLQHFSPERRFARIEMLADTLVQKTPLRVATPRPATEGSHAP